mmetsp:Transcript_1477/g.9006  ORF Transcript_1477/g.9006 Transcript_1477/m.9006 type:complete len:205 (-) Transcript_1477:475-1089(-)
MDVQSKYRIRVQAPASHALYHVTYVCIDIPASIVHRIPVPSVSRSPLCRRRLSFPHSHRAYLSRRRHGSRSRVTFAAALPVGSTDGCGSSSSFRLLSRTFWNRSVAVTNGSCQHLDSVPTKYDPNGRMKLGNTSFASSNGSSSTTSLRRDARAHPPLHKPSPMCWIVMDCRGKRCGSHAGVRGRHSQSQRNARRNCRTKRKRRT